MLISVFITLYLQEHTYSAEQKTDNPETIHTNITGTHGEEAIVPPESRKESQSQNLNLPEVYVRCFITNTIRPCLIFFL